MLNAELLPIKVYPCYRVIKTGDGGCMMRKLLAFCAIAVGGMSSLFGGLQKDIDRAIGIIHQFEASSPQTIPNEVLKNAKGLVIVKIVKLAFLASGTGGYGIVLGKTFTGWTAPSGIGIGGAGIGLQIGGEGTDLILVLNTEEALNMFKNHTKVTLGSDISMTAGPIGRTLERSHLLPQAEIYSYALSEGLFAGVSLENTLFIERKKANEKYYGKPVTANELLSGTIGRPSGAKALYRELDKYSN